MVFIQDHVIAQATFFEKLPYDLILKLKDTAMFRSIRQDGILSVPGVYPHPVLPMVFHFSLC